MCETDRTQHAFQLARKAFHMSASAMKRFQIGRIWKGVKIQSTFLDLTPIVSSLDISALAARWMWKAHVTICKALRCVSLPPSFLNCAELPCRENGESVGLDAPGIDLKRLPAAREGARPKVSS